MRILEAMTLALLGASALALSQAGPAVSLMPLPRQLSMGTGELDLDRGFSLQVEADPADQITRSAVDRLLQSLERETGSSIPVEFRLSTSAPASGALSIVVHNSSPMRIGADESYTLTITPEGARLQAAGSIGALRGMATIRQLIQKDGRRVFLPALTIEDSPLYPWRGLMIDVARHFIPLEVLERNLDAMELVKLNVLHLHLSDNEGFRVESKVFPRLQTEGSNGQYYTQAGMRDLIRYAELRGILIVPEFDMPSHAKSWFAGYPELSSSPGPFKPGVLVYEGITSKSTLMEMGAAMQTAKVPAFDPTRESTYQFLDKFVLEMSQLFPAPYFHIGADENNGAVWLANPAIVAFMQSHHFADAPALQAYFVERMRAIVASHGKQMVAWEEAYAPDTSRDTIFQAWSPMAKTDLLRTPMNNGNKVLVSRGFYLDLFYPAHAHYLNDALPANADAGTDKSLLGGEAAIWTELADRWNIEARTWPRTGAIAERLWSTPDALDVSDMYRRLFQLSSLLDREGVHNLADYDVQIKRLAGSLPVEPVKTLLDVLIPIKGYRRLSGEGFNPPAERDAAPPLNRVADVVLVDSAAKYEFRNAVADYLKTHGAASEQTLRAWLQLWSRNDALLDPYLAQSKDLQEVSDHAKRLSALAGAALRALDRFDRGEPLSASQLAEDDALLKSANSSDGETEIAVLPEIEALLHGNLPPQPTSYALF
jgi:hexosaminidase